ncbi:glycosyltransferase [Mesobacillus foraminis]|uniref:glycosyltransferase n=1 Tax=Mesobacillus foraminis TaxID=279826 RepID=UPI001BEA5ED5|nr:glycosyltransferase [Mesobacillus foraminis]MBT2756350.1 glycosyltransferase [Mesobacillus foraminis]
MSKKICMLVADHPFMDSRIYKKEAKSLQKKGYKVTLIVPRKNGYLFDIDGKPFTGQYLNKTFKHEGIKIVTYNWEDSRVPLSKVTGSVKAWEKEGFNNPLTQLAIKEDADIYHVHEYLSLFAGIGVKRMMKKVKGKDIKLVYDSHELTPDPIDTRYSEPARKNLLEKLFIMLKEVDCIITISDSIKSWYLTQNPGLLVEVIYNSPPLTSEYNPKEYKTDSLIACYEGNIDNKRGSQEKIFEISEICSKQIDFQFKVIGGIRFGESIEIPDHLSSVITMTGWVDYYSISKHMADVDIGWIDYADIGQSLNRTYALPNKFFSFLNNGVPVVVNKCHEMESFIRNHHCGLVVDHPEATAQDYAEAFLYLHKHKEKLKDMSRNARKAMEETYSWEKMEKRLYRLYDGLMNNDLGYLK